MSESTPQGHVRVRMAPSPTGSPHVGLVRTEQTDLHYGGQDGVAAIERTVPLGRLAEPRDVGSVAAFLASRISDSDPLLTSWHAARMGIVLYFIPIFFLFEPALILQGPLYLSAIWVTLNILAVIVIAGASEGRLMYVGRLKMWTRPILFAAGLLIGFPEWTSTLVGLAVTAGLLLMRGIAWEPDSADDGPAAIPAAASLDLPPK